MVHAQVKDYVMIQLAPASVMKGLKEALAKVCFCKIRLICMYMQKFISFVQINHVLVEANHVVGMDNVIILQASAHAMKEIKVRIVQVKSYTSSIIQNRDHNKIIFFRANLS